MQAAARLAYILSGLHVAFAVLCPQIRGALVRTVLAGVWDTGTHLFELDVSLNAEWGAAHFVYVGVQLATLGSIMHDWLPRERGAPLRPAIGITTVVSSACMWCITPGTGYFFGIPMGIGMLLVTRGGGGTITANTLGQGMKIVAIVHWGFAAVPPVVQLGSRNPFIRPGTFTFGAPVLHAALKSVLDRGVWSTNEMSGLLSCFRSGYCLGDAWGVAHFMLVGVQWWVLGSCIQDWDSMCHNMRYSTGILMIIGAFVMMFIIPGSAYWIWILWGVSLLHLRVTENQKCSK